MKMKALLLLGALAMALPAAAQVKIGNNPQAIDPASLLELESTDQVLVITRVTTAQMEAITPNAGALVYNTDADCLYYYDGALWVNICEALPVAFDNQAIVNPAPTIVITPVGDTLNFEVGLNAIRSENIVDFTIGSQDIQNGAINDQKLASNSVGTEELQDNAVTDDAINYGVVTLQDFTNDAGFITAANVISSDLGNDLTAGGDGGAYFDAEPLEVMIFENADAITALQNEKEDVNNKDPNVNLGNSDVAYPTQNAVKTYVDDAILASTQTIVSADTPNSISTGSDGGALLDIGPIQTQADATEADLAAHVSNDNDLDDQNEWITSLLVNGSELQITEGGIIKVVDLSALSGVGSDNQQISTNGNPGNIDLQNGGGPITINVNDADFEPTNEIQNIAEVLSDGNDAGALQIKNIADPTEPQDAATRAYVDNQTFTGVIVSNDAENSITAGIDGGAFYNDPDNNPSNEIQNLAEVLSDGNDAGALQIKNIADPTEPQDAATRAYVDNQTFSGVIVSTDADNSVTAGIDGGAFYNDPDNNPSNEIQNIAEVLSDGNNAGALQIKNIADPTDPQDAATRAYVDAISVIGNEGSVFFADATGSPTENNNQLFWDNNLTMLSIGTATRPLQNKLTVAGTTRTSGLLNSNGTNGLPSYRFSENLNSGMYLEDASGILAFSTNSTEAIRIDNSQNVGIAQPLPQARLHVGGDVRADGNFISNNTAIQTPDYVFQSYFNGASALKPDYQMPSLAEVREFVAKHHHLPGVTSAEEVRAQGGIILNHATTQNLEKIEELFLHTLEQQEQIDALKEENTQLSGELENMKARMARLEALLSQKSGD